jgi:hypothetical protein
MMRRFIFPILTLSISLTACVDKYPSQTYNTVVTVKDRTGKPVAGVTVNLFKNSSGSPTTNDLKRSFSTNSAGQANFEYTLALDEAVTQFAVFQAQDGDIWKGLAVKNHTYNGSKGKNATENITLEADSLTDFKVRLRKTTDTLLSVYLSLKIDEQVNIQKRDFGSFSKDAVRQLDTVLNFRTFSNTTFKIYGGTAKSNGIFYVESVNRDVNPANFRNITFDLTFK